MADAAPSTPTQESGWLSTTFKWVAAPLLTAISPAAGLAYGGYQAYNYLTGGAQEAALTNAANPSTLVLEKLGQSEAFKGPEGQAALAKIKADTQFTAALDAAIKRDPSVAPGLLASASGQEGGLDLNKLAASLQNDGTRKTFTDMLNAVARNPNDELNFGWMTNVATSIEQNKLGQAQTLLAQGGVSNSDIDLGAGMQDDPIGTITGFLTDPTKRGAAIKGWLDKPDGPFHNLSPENKNMVAGLLDAVAKFFGMYMGPGGFAAPYVQFAQRLGGELGNSGASITGVPNTPTPPKPDGGADLVGASNNPQASARLASSFNPGGLNRPVAEPDADAPTPQVQVARVDNQVQGGTFSGGRMPG